MVYVAGSGEFSVHGGRVGDMPLWPMSSIFSAPPPCPRLTYARLPCYAPFTIKDTRASVCHDPDVGHIKMGKLVRVQCCRATVLQHHDAAQPDYQPPLSLEIPSSNEGNERGCCCVHESRLAAGFFMPTAFCLRPS
jgi:hypothetical protein